MSVSAGSVLAATRTRPTTIVVATWVNIAFNMLGFGVFLLPGSAEIPEVAIVVGGAIGVISVMLAWPVWRAKRWAAIALTVITILNMLSALPGLFDPPSREIVATILAGIPFAAVITWLLWHPDSRRFYRGG